MRGLTKESSIIIITTKAYSYKNDPKGGISYLDKTTQEFPSQNQFNVISRNQRIEMEEKHKQSKE